MKSDLFFSNSFSVGTACSDYLSSSGYVCVCVCVCLCMYTFLCSQISFPILQEGILMLDNIFLSLIMY